MENRDRDKVSQGTGSTSAGSVNRNTSSKKGQQSNDSSADFGQSIGRSENWDNEPSRRSGSGSSSDSSSSSSSDMNSNSGDSGRSSGSSRH